MNEESERQYDEERDSLLATGVFGVTNRWVSASVLGVDEIIVAPCPVDGLASAWACGLEYSPVTEAQSGRVVLVLVLDDGNAVRDCLPGLDSVVRLP